MNFARPKALHRGDTVRVIAPAGPFDRESFDAGLRLISPHYNATHRPDVFASDKYLAGLDERRLSELVDALCDDSAAVFSARGGYGVMRLLSRVPWERVKPKVVVGFSDITALHLALQSRGIVSIHAPVLTQLGRQPDEVVNRLFELIEQPSPVAPIKGSRTLVAGSVEGPLIGGNLSVLTRLLGTPFMPELSGAILLLEDVGERPYRLDRMWTHLELAGVFRKVRGIVLGDFTGCEEKGAAYTSMEVLGALAEKTGLPCAAGFRIGHGDVNLPVPLGVNVRLDSDAARLHFLEPAVS